MYCRRPTSKTTGKALLEIVQSRVTLGVIVRENRIVLQMKNSRELFMRILGVNFPEHAGKELLI